MQGAQQGGHEKKIEVCPVTACRDPNKTEQCGHRPLQSMTRKGTFCVCWNTMGQTKKGVMHCATHLFIALDPAL